MGGRAKQVLYERQFSLPEGSSGTLSAICSPIIAPRKVAENSESRNQCFLDKA